MARATIGSITRGAVEVGVCVGVGVGVGRGVSVGVADAISVYVRVEVAVLVGAVVFVSVAVGGRGVWVCVCLGGTAVFVRTRPVLSSSPDVHPTSADNTSTATRTPWVALRDRTQWNDRAGFREARVTVSGSGEPSAATPLP